MAMCWDKNMDIGEGTGQNLQLTEFPINNYKLEVFYGTDTTGEPIATLNTQYTNTELLQFNVTQGGTYTIVVTDLSPELTGGHQVAIAWY